jgi:hypothetical protein
VSAVNFIVVSAYCCNDSNSILAVLLVLCELHRNSKKYNFLILLVLLCILIMLSSNIGLGVYAFYLCCADFSYQYFSFYVLR